MSEKKEIAVLSDVHGNHIALKRCVELALSRDIRTFYFLGDYAGELACPERTMEYLYDLNEEYSCTFIKGNKECYWLNYRADGEKGWRDEDSTTGSMLYTYERLSERDLAFFSGLPSAEMVIEDGMPGIMLCHGSPYQVNEKMLPGEKRTYEIMDSAKSSVILCGHTHVQTRMEYHGKCVWNPGSVGVPLYSEGKTQFMILHGSDHGWFPEFISLDYDVDKVIGELYESGMDRHAPYWCRVTENLLRRGDMPHGVVLERVMKLCAAETGSCTWPDLPERFWKQAAEELLEG